MINKISYLQFREAQGFFGHKGRPGSLGGSMPRSSSDTLPTASPIPEDIKRKQAEDLAKTGFTYEYAPPPGEEKIAEKFMKLMKKLKDDYDVQGDEKGIRISDEHSEDYEDFTSYKKALDWIEEREHNLDEEAKALHEYSSGGKD